MYARRPNITSDVAATSEGANKVPQTLHLPIISQNDKNDNPHEYLTLLQQQYSLRSHALHVAASVIIKEPHHVKTFTQHRKFGDPPLSDKSKFETNNQPLTYVPPNYAYAIIDPNSGNELEYRNLIN